MYVMYSMILSLTLNIIGINTFQLDDLNLNQDSSIQTFQTKYLGKPYYAFLLIHMRTHTAT